MRKCRRWVELLALGLAIALTSMAIKGQQTARNNRCGPLSLSYAAKVAGYPEATLALLERRLAGRSETTLTELGQVATECDVQALREQSLRIEPRQCPAIVWLPEGHFVVVEEVQGERLRIYDPGRIVAHRTWSTSTFPNGPVVV